MLAIYLGEDDYTRKAAIAALRGALGDPEMASLNTTTLSAREAVPGEVIAQANAMPFMALGRLIVIEGLLALFEPSPSQRPARNRSTRRDQHGESSVNFKGWETLASASGTFPRTTTLVLSDGPIAASNPLLALLAPVSEVRRFQPLQGPILAEWILGKVRDGSGAIDPAAVRLLADNVGGNLWMLDAELSKLTLHARGRTITVADVQTLVSAARPENTFALVDLIISGNYAGVRRRVQRILEEEAEAAKFVSILGSQVRRLIMAKDLHARKISGPPLKTMLGTQSDFAVNRAVDQSARFSMPQLVRMHRLLLEHDLAIKTGVLDDKIALEMLIVNLCSVRAAPRSE